MPKLLLAALAQVAVLDARTNALSLVNILDAIRPASFPIPLGEIRCVTVWERLGQEDQAFEARAVPEAPDGTRQEQAAVSSVLESDRTLHRWFANLPLWHATEPGVWHIVIQVRQGENWADVGRVRLEVQPPAAAEGPAAE